MDYRLLKFLHVSEFPIYHQGLWFCNEWLVVDEHFKVEVMRSSGQ